MDLFGDLPNPNASESENDNKGDALIEKETKHFSIIEKRKLESDCHNNGENTNCPSVKRKCLEDHTTEPPNDDSVYLEGFVAARQGEREDMQDAHFIFNDFHSQIKDLHSSIKRLSLFAVFDGHGGGRASKFASQNLVANLIEKFPKGEFAQAEKEIKKVFVDSFKKTDEEFLKEATKSKPSWKDGTTALVVLAINETLFIANLGDSKAVLCRYKESEARCVGIPLTKDHSPSVYEERIRIQKAGGVVRDGRVMGVLEVARSIGDGPYKNHGVTCVPDVKRCQLNQNDKFIIIACDGLWKSYTVDESIEFVNKILEDEAITASGNKRADEIRYEAACSKLASSAVLKLSGDNVTVLIVSVNKLKPQ